MKKLIAISVVFALAAGVAFAVDLGGTVIGTVKVVVADSNNGSDITAGGSFNRLRLEGAGEAGDGKYGGWLRVEGEDAGFSGLAWWKPIDQFKITIGNNPDGMWGKEGVTGWMFYQSASDTGVADGGDNVWSGDGVYKQGLKYRNAFYRGFGENGLLLEIKPIDMIGINIGIPFIAKDGDKLEDIFKALVAQVDLNFSFGNIAITYEGEGSYIQQGNVGWSGGTGGTIFGYFGLTAIENLGLDVGVGLQLNDEDGSKNPFAVGLGFKYAAGAFGIKFRTALSIPAEDTQDFKVLADVLPYFAINDNARVYVSAGLGLRAPDDGDAVVGWRVNPYVEIGEEWGPKFLAGIQLWSDGVKGADDNTVINFSIPIALSVSF